MKKYCVFVVVVVVFAGLFVAGLWFIKGHYDTEARVLRDYEKENYKLGLLAERREYQFKIATFESKMNMRVAKEVKPPDPEIPPADPNE